MPIMPMPPTRTMGAPSDQMPAAPDMGGGDISSLLGGAAPPAEAMTPNMGDMKTQFMELIRQLTGLSTSMAQQYPAFAPFADAITRAAQEGMMSVISQMAAQVQTPNPMAIV